MGSSDIGRNFHKDNLFVACSSLHFNINKSTAVVCEGQVLFSIEWNETLIIYNHEPYSHSHCCREKQHCCEAIFIVLPILNNKSHFPAWSLVTRVYMRFVHWLDFRNIYAQCASGRHGQLNVKTDSRNTISSKQIEFMLAQLQKSRQCYHCVE